jgi:hypothetical protein
MLGVPATRIWKWRCEGADSPPAIQINGRLRFYKDELLAWVETRRESVEVGR